VVKADGYGLGAVGAARALAQAGARAFFTATSSEGVRVRRALGEGPQIFVLTGPTNADHESPLANKLTPKI
jgi:alanine racemase